MRISIVLVGESFRLGGQGTRNRDSQESYEEQKRACLSHLKLAEALASEGHQVDFFIESYATKYESELISLYGERLKGFSFRDAMVGIQALARAALSKYEHECVFVCRIDIALKGMMISMFDPEWQKVMFPSACWVHDCRCGNFPRVSDTMMFVPPRLLDRVRGRLFLGHTAWKEFVDSRTLESCDMGLVLDTYHDSDSAKDYNPIYTIVNRPESKLWHSMGCVVGEDFAPVQTWEKRRFPDWSPRDMLPGRKRGESLEGMWEWWHRDQGSEIFRFINPIRFAKSEIFGQSVEYYENRDQRYWFMDGDAMVIMDETRKVSSRLARVSEDVYSGPYEFNRGITFTIRRLKTEEWD